MNSNSMLVAAFETRRPAAVDPEVTLHPDMPTPRRRPGDMTRPPMARRIPPRLKDTDARPVHRVARYLGVTPRDLITQIAALTGEHIPSVNSLIPSPVLRTIGVTAQDVR